jgi:GTP-binding protein HflX
MVRVAIVGYTNVGKSTLLNLLTKSDVLAENKLFATVDSTVRKVVYEDIPFLLTDTVGFIRKLPTHLIESFKSTLDEVREADILLHVVDISHVAYQEQIDTVNSILADIKAGDKPTIYVFNKMDAFHVEETTNLELDFEEVTLPVTLDDLKQSYLTKQDKQAVFISAKVKENIEELRAKLLIEVRKKHIQIFPNYLKTQVYYGNDVVE